MSYTTLEKKVFGTVKGAPDTTESRTEYFKIRNRAHAPRPLRFSDTSDGTRGENDCGPGTDSTGVLNTEGEDEVFDSYNESDSSAEMALIPKVFKGPRVTELDPVRKGGTEANPQSKGHESTGQSSLDATLSELRHQETPRPSGTSEAPKRKQRRLTRGVPMKEEFFSKIGWTRSFISGPADPLHNPHMVWCHICMKNISVKTKGTLEILRHHRTEKPLRKDQRWRYEHLKNVHPVTGKVQHRVRGRNGKVLSKI